MKKITCPVCHGDSRGEECSRCGGQLHVIEAEEADLQQVAALHTKLSDLFLELAGVQDLLEWDSNDAVTNVSKHKAIADYFHIKIEQIHTKGA